MALLNKHLLTMSSDVSKRRKMLIIVGSLVCITLFFLFKSSIFQSVLEQNSSSTTTTSEQHDDASKSEHLKLSSRSSQRTPRNKNVVSFFPIKKLEQEFVEFLDISSMRSSLGPRLQNGKNRLQDYLPAPTIKVNKITFNEKFQNNGDLTVN